MGGSSTLTPNSNPKWYVRGVLARKRARSLSGCKLSRLIESIFGRGFPPVRELGKGLSKLGKILQRFSSIVDGGGITGT